LTTSPENLLGSKPNRYPAQQEKVPRRRHAPGALPGGATGGGGGRVGGVVATRVRGGRGKEVGSISFAYIVSRKYTIINIVFYICFLQLRQ
jgi:hypothetical protein